MKVRGSFRSMQACHVVLAFIVGCGCDSSRGGIRADSCDGGPCGQVTPSAAARTLQEVVVYQLPWHSEFPTLAPSELVMGHLGELRVPRYVITDSASLDRIESTLNRLRTGGSLDAKSADACTSVAVLAVGRTASGARPWIAVPREGTCVEAGVGERRDGFWPLDCEILVLLTSGLNRQYAAEGLKLSGCLVPVVSHAPIAPIRVHP